MKKAQIRIGESIAVLFIFLIFIVIGFSFYAKVQRASSKTQQEENIDLRAIEIAERASFLPELQCSRGNIVVDNCVDILKVEAFNGMIRNDPELIKKHYYSVLGFSTITVEEIYPDVKAWTIYNNSLNDSSRIFTPIPISLYDAKNGKYYFGVLNVNYYPLS